MNTSPFVLVTGNLGKLREASRIVGFDLDYADIDLPEVQSLEIQEVLRHKAEEAQRLVRRPVVVEETGFYLDAMGGFPGPLVKWMLEAMGPEGVARTGLALGDVGARAVCALAYFDGKRLITAEGETRGRLVAEPRGEHGFGWDPIFEPEGSSQTFAELSPDVKDEIGHRGRAWKVFGRRLEEASILSGRDLTN